MNAEQLILYPEDAGWPVHVVCEFECQPVGKDRAEPLDTVQDIMFTFGVSREEDEPVDEDGEILTGACRLESFWRGPAAETSGLLARF